VKAQESVYNIPQHLLVEGLTFAKFKAEVSEDSPLWSMLEDYKKKSKTSNLFCERKPRNRDNPTVCKNASDVLKCVKSQVSFCIEATQLVFGRKTSIGDEGAKAIGSALQGNTTLTILYLYSNSIGDEGAKAIGFALQGNTTLTYLDLRKNRLSSTSMDVIKLHWRNRNANLSL